MPKNDRVSNDRAKEKNEKRAKLWYSNGIQPSCAFMKYQQIKRGKNVFTFRFIYFFFFGYSLFGF